VNGKNVKRFFQMLALSTTFHLKFSVGNEEIHEVDVQRIRKRVLGSFVPQTYRVIVDGKLMVEQVGPVRRSRVALFRVSSRKCCLPRAEPLLTVTATLKDSRKSYGNT
jgi:hypothetical protein